MADNVTELASRAKDAVVDAVDAATGAAAGVAKPKKEMSQRQDCLLPVSF